MGNIVVVAEKPSVARDIARILNASQRQEGFFSGNGYQVTWALGHLVALCDPGEMNPAWQRWQFATLPMLPQDMKTKVLPKTKKQYQVVAKLICHRDTDEVICATDSGREGELIFRLIYGQAGCKKPVKRLWISSMTDEAIKGGLGQMKDWAHYDTLYDSAWCRSHADWLVGMNASRAFSLKYDLNLSVGRVQTPTLAILVRRRDEIERFVPVEYWEVTADYGDFTGLWYDPVGDTTRIGDEESAKQIVQRIKGGLAVVESVATEQKQTAPPQLYDLTSLQRDANAQYGLSAAKTLETAQSLYEKHKMLTYPRTDSRYLPLDMRANARKAVASLRPSYGAVCEPVLAQEQLPLLKRVFDDAKVTDHHAILPTGRTSSGLSDLEKKVFDLVARRLLAAFYPPYRYDATKAILACGQDKLLSRGTVVTDLGWRAVYAGQDDKKAEAVLPQLAVGDERRIQKASQKKKATKPPSPHTEATLLSAMEHAGREIEEESIRESMKDSGLGTPATRAAIIERLIAVGYVQRKGKALLPTDKGVQLIRVSPEEITSAETTGKWERALESIRKGGMQSARFMESIRRFSAFLVDFAQSKAPPKEQAGFPEEVRVYKPTYVPGAVCPLCGARVVENSAAFSCAKWREGCKFTVWRNLAQRQGGPLLDRKLFSKLMKENAADTPAGAFSRDGARVTYRPGPGENATPI